MTLEIRWDEFENLLIRDVQQKWHDRIKHFMLENYFKPHPLYNVLKYQDDPGINDAYLRYVSHILNDECSIVVLDEETNEIHAVALLKWMTKEWKSWTILRAICVKSRLDEDTKLRHKLFSDYVEQNPDHPFDSLHLFEYYMTEELEIDREFVEKFFNAICEVARHMKMPRVTFMALSNDEKVHAKFAGFNELTKAIYSMLVIDGRRPYAPLRDMDEMHAILFERMVDPIVSYKEMPGFEEVERKMLEERMRLEAEKQDMAL